MSNKIKCTKCGYELIPGSHNKCPRCGSIINNCHGCSGNCLKCNVRNTQKSSQG